MSLKKLLKKITPNTDKLTPQFVKKSETLTNLSSANIAFSNMQFADKVASAPSLKPKDIRPLLREKHELNTTPFGKTSKLIYRRDQLDPGDPERERLTAQINASTLRRGKVGIAVGGTVVGGVGGKAISAVGGAATRENPTPNEAADNMYPQAATWRDPNGYPDPWEQMYSRNPQGIPIANRRTLNASAPNGGGLISKVVGALWSFLVPKKQGTSVNVVATKPKSGLMYPGGSATFDETGRRRRVF